MTTHCFERSSLLRRLLGGILFTTLPPRQQFFIALLCGAEDDGFLSQ